MSYEINEIPGQEITEPVSLEFQKAWSRVDNDYQGDDLVLSSMITSAREMLEKYLNVALVRRDFEIVWNGGLLQLPYNHKAEVVSLMNGDDPVEYALNNGWLHIGANAGNYNYFYNMTDWLLEVTQLTPIEPDTTYTLRYTTGYEVLPQALKQAIAEQADWNFKNQGMPENYGLCPAAIAKANPFSKNLVL